MIRRALIGMVAVMALLGLGFTPALADPEPGQGGMAPGHGKMEGHAKEKGRGKDYGHGKGEGYGREHGKGCCEGHGEGYGKGYGGHGMGGHSGAGHLIRSLLKYAKGFGLTDEQVAKLKAIQLDLDKTRIRTEADIMVAERELQALLEDEKSDMAAIEAKVKQSEELEVGLRVAAIKAKRDAKAVLTPEQRERLKAVHERMKGDGKEGKDGGKESGKEH